MAFTKVTGPGIHTQANILSHNINSSGIITATEFSGPLVGNTNNASGISTFYDLRVSNNLTVEGTTTTLDTNLVGVDRVEVGANSNTVVGVAITQSGTADILRLYDGSTQVVTVLDTGEVGIGENTPDTNLHVKGTGTDVLKIESTDAGAQGTNLILQHSPGAGNMADNDVISLIQFAGVDDSNNVTTYSSIRAVATDVSNNNESGDITFHTRNAGTFDERLRIHSNGAISAGVDNDSYELTLQGMSGGAPTLWLRDGTTSGSPRILFGDTGAATRSAIYHKNSNDSLNFYTNGEVLVGDERLTITSAGKVGIGSATPSSQLDIKRGNVSGTYPNGNAKPSGASIWNDGGDTFTGRLFVQGTALSASSDFLTGMNNEGNVLVVYNYGSSKYMQKWHKDAQVELMYNGNTKLNTRIDGVKITGGTDISMNSNGTGQLYMTGNGYTGGIALDGTAMNIYHNSGSRAIIFGTNEDEKLRISSAGRVGINSTVPTAPLNAQAETSTGICLRLNQEPTDKRAYIQFQDYATTGTDSYILNEGYDLTVYGGYGGKLNLGAYDTTGITVRSTGLVGVGTENPLSGLHISDGTAYGSPQNSSRKATLTISAGSEGSSDIQLLSANYNHIFFGDSADPNTGIIWYEHTGGGTDSMNFSTSGNQRLRITSNGSLLLGGTADVTDLTGDPTGQRGLVIGNTGMGNAGIAIINSTTGTGRIYFGDNTGSSADRHRGFINYYHNDSVNSDFMTIGTAGAEALRIQSDGNFGFGTSSTIRERMHLHTASSDEAYLRFTNTGTGTDAGDGFNIGINSAEQALIWNKEYTDMLFGTHGATRLTISKDGKATFTEEIETPQDYPNYRPTVDFNFVAVKKLDPRFTYVRTGPASYIDHLGFVRLVDGNIPRFDHDPDTGESKGLLIEESRINLIPWSFDGGNWSIGSGGNTVTRNAGTAPDGTETATKVLSASNDIDVNTQLGNASPGATGQISISGSTTYTLSVWVKASTTAQVGNNFKVRWKRVQGDSTFAENAFALPANWTRYTATATTAANNSTIACYVGGVSGSEALVWGAQFEAGAYATSLIPTHGQSVTRGDETVTMEGEEFTDFYNQEEGTIVLSASYTEDQRTSAIVTIDDTSNSSEYTEVGYRAGGAGSGAVASYIRTDAGNDQYYKQYTSSATQGNEFKVALGYKDDDYASSANGQTVHTDTSGTTSKVYDRLRFNHVDSVSPPIGSGHIRRFMYYPKRLPNGQVVTLTA